MSFLGFIEKMRKKPETARKRIVFLSTIAITGIIFILWLATLTTRNNTSSQNQEAVKGPFESIKDGVLNFYESVQRTINK